MYKSYKTTVGSSKAESPKATGYIVAIVSVVGGTLLLPPFPLLFLGIIALALLIVIILVSVILVRCLLYSVRHQTTIQKHSPIERYSSQAPVPVNHAGIVSDI